MNNSDLKYGTICQHYKGKKYKIHGIAVDSESLEELVVYEALYENNISKMWARPKKMFLENVKVNGELQPRFLKLIEDTQDPRYKSRK